MKYSGRIRLNRRGSVLLIFTYILVVLFGSTALVIDVGQLYVAKAKTQKAADAAAMAAVIDLPSTTEATSTAYIFGEINDISSGDMDVITPYEGDSTKIRVACRMNVDYLLANLIGFSDGQVEAEAVASKAPWEGDALPFLNMDDDYTQNTEIVAWEDVYSGDFESIDNFEIYNPDNPSNVYFKVDYRNGVVLKKGVVATVKQEIGWIYNRLEQVYVLSLRDDIIRSGNILLTDGTLKCITFLKEGDIVDLSQLVLLKCEFYEYDDTGKTLYLHYLEEYDIGAGEYPPDYIAPDGGNSMLIS